MVFLYLLTFSLWALLTFIFRNNNNNNNNSRNSNNIITTRSTTRSTTTTTTTFLTYNNRAPACTLSTSEGFFLRIYSSGRHRRRSGRRCKGDMARTATWFRKTFRFFLFRPPVPTRADRGVTTEVQRGPPSSFEALPSSSSWSRTKTLKRRWNFWTFCCLV